MYCDGIKLQSYNKNCQVKITRVIINVSYYISTINSHFSVNACLAPLCSVDHMAVTTVEGIGSTRTKLHPVQVNNCYIMILRYIVD